MRIQIPCKIPFILVYANLGYRHMDQKKCKKSQNIFLQQPVKTFATRKTYAMITAERYAILHPF